MLVARVLVARVLVAPAVVLEDPAPLVLAAAVQAPGPFSKTLACAAKVHDVPLSDPVAYGLATLHTLPVFKAVSRLELSSPITSPPNKRRDWSENISWMTSLTSC